MNKRLLRLALLTSATVAGCFPEWNFGGEVVIGQSDINVLDPVQMRVSGRTQGLEYRFTADRGSVENPERDTTATYYAPYTCGADTIHISTVERTQGTIVGQQDVQVLVNGETLSYVDTKGRSLGAFDNGLVRITPVRGFGRNVPLAEGRMPAISPNGHFMAYVKHLGDGTSQIVVRDPAGSERNIVDHPSLNVDPAWAPAKADHLVELVFSSDRLRAGQSGSGKGRSEHFNLWRINVDTGSLSPLTTLAASARQPSWSPDGRYMAFSSNLDNDRSQDYWNLYLMDLQSGRLTKLTNEATPTLGAFEPSISPKGNRVAYVRKYVPPTLDPQTPVQKTFVMDIALDSPVSSARSTSGGAGYIVTSLEDPKQAEGSPSWSPDGSEIAFVQGIGPESRVWRVIANAANAGSKSDQRAEVGAIKGIEARWAKWALVGGTNLTQR